MNWCVEWQIDELVAQAFDIKAMGQQGSKEVESFARVLSEILSSLQVNVSAISLHSVQLACILLQN